MRAFWSQSQVVTDWLLELFEFELFVVDELT